MKVKSGLFEFVILVLFILLIHVNKGFGEIYNSLGGRSRLRNIDGTPIFRHWNNGYLHPHISSYSNVNQPYQQLAPTPTASTVSASSLTENLSTGQFGQTTFGQGQGQGQPRRTRAPVLQQDNYSFNNRQSRFLSLFTFVQFSNQECMGATGDNGTCLTAQQCLQRGGSSNGPCAGGYGICCVFLATCGMTVRENGTYFVHSGYPTIYDGTGSCQITLMKMNLDVCQYRLDFDQFQIMGPESQNNICNNDQFIVSGGNPVPPICGLNSGNHMYIDAGGSGSSNPITLSVVTSGPSYRRSWKIRISQIPCNAPYKAEDGCLQYFTGVAGQIMSFNYEPTSGLHLSNQDYSICVRTERNFCGIQYAQCMDTVNNRSTSFTLSGNTLGNNGVPAMVGSTGTGNFCQNDYLVIPMAMNVGRPVTGNSPNVDRICGGTLAADVSLQSTPIRSNVKPFRLYFHTDSRESPQDQGNRGFCLNYVQQPCTNTLA